MTVGLWWVFTKTKEVLQKADGAVYIPIAGKAGSCTAPVGLTCITLKVLLRTKNRVIFESPSPCSVLNRKPALANERLS